MVGLSAGREAVLLRSVRESLWSLSSGVVDLLRIRWTGVGTMRRRDGRSSPCFSAARTLSGFCEEAEEEACRWEGLLSPARSLGEGSISGFSIFGVILDLASDIPGGIKGQEARKHTSTQSGIGGYQATMLRWSI